MTPALSRPGTTSAKTNAELEQREASAAPTAEEIATVFPVTETRILLEGISWETYESLLKETGDKRNKRFAYCDGILEIMVPLPDHERPIRLFEHFVGVFVDALELEMLSLGSLTMKKPEQKKGLEPDCCFYIKNEAMVRGLDKLDFEVNPPPDLAIEVDNSSGSLDKFPIYVALKVPEIWRLRRGVLTMYGLNDEQTGYVELEQSLAFVHLPVRELPSFLQRAKVVGQRSAVRELGQCVEQMLEQQ